MSLESIEGTDYGPVVLEICPAKVAEFVAATRDDPGRWSTHAPPSYAAALLFVLAPSFLYSPPVSDYTQTMIHTDQQFVWHGPITIGEEVVIAARVGRVRSRGDAFFVKFLASVSSGGDPLIDSTSTFLMRSAPMDPPEEVLEPAVRDSGPNDPPDEWGGVVRRSASRIDLVRYAGASGDFNPIHYDHGAARQAGLAGVVVHGLLEAAWVTQKAGSYRPRPDPLIDIKLRFRSPLLAGSSAEVKGVLEEAADTVSLSVESNGAQVVSGLATLRGE